MVKLIDLFQSFMKLIKNINISSSNDGGHVFLHFDPRQSSCILTIFTALTFTVFPTFHSKIITVAIFFLAATLLTITALKLLMVLFLVPKTKSSRISH
jgi:hypothetical protein